jgi:cytochrome P450
LAYLLMRNPKYYHAPLEYRPQRWMLTKSAEEDIATARSAFCPFSIGPTGCVGKAWALVELKITVAQLLFKYDICEERTDKERNMSFAERLSQRERHSLDRFVITNQGPLVKFRLSSKSV